MGNRAVITFSTASSAPAIYLHWNGGRASVEGFLTAAKQLGLRSNRWTLDTVDSLAELIARHFFGVDVGFTVYRQKYGQTDRDNGDNGVYVLDNNLNIKKRLHMPSYQPFKEETNPEKTADIVETITSRAPIFND